MGGFCILGTQNIGSDLSSSQNLQNFGQAFFNHLYELFPHYGMCSFQIYIR